ncbi:MAG: glycine cleavage system aminomethyltransferase GcvT [Chromatocurvus sp.]
MTDNHQPLLETPLADLHRDCGAKMTPFAGYDMPLQFALGVRREHLHTRQHAGLFDVSHMGQLMLRGPDVERALEALMPSDIVGLAEGRQRYGLLTNPAGGIIDDLMVARHRDGLFLVVNAARKAVDMDHLSRHLPSQIALELLEDRALLALQGPAAEAVMVSLQPAVADMRFMDSQTLDIGGATCIVSRSGYTGEDGFELSVPASQAVSLARKLLDSSEVEPIGLGARNSLRLEAGLCLYGNDIDMTTTPVEAGLKWAISPARRPGGARAGGYTGDRTIEQQLDTGNWPRQRVGLLGEGRAPVREDAPLFSDSGAAIGKVTSGVFGPSVDGPVAMGYVEKALASPGTRVLAEVRGKRLPMTVTRMPFFTPGYKRG